MQALIYRGSDFEIHAARRTLTRLGEAVECEPRVFDLIVYLIEQRDRAVGKQELIDVLWNGRPVSDASLSQLVYKARRALADQGDARACIRTVHGRGFRWVAAITVCEHAEAATGVDAANLPTPVAVADPPSHAPQVRRDAAHRHAARRRALRWAVAALVLVALAGAWQFVARPGTRAAPLRVLVLPVDVDATLGDLAWTRLGVMGLVATSLETDAGLATVEPATARRLAVADASPAQRRAWREATGARYSLSLHLGRAGPLLQLDAVLDGADGERRRSLFGEEAGRLALDMSSVVRSWLDPHPRGNAPPRELDGEVASTYALGLDAQLRGDMDAARKYFALCVERAPEAPQPRLQLALVELKFGDAQRAAALVDEVLARVDAGRALHVALDAQRIAGYVELQRGRLDAARAAFERARGLFRADATATQRASVFDGLAQVATRSARFAEAASAFEASLALYQGAGDAIGEAVAWNNIGVLERMRGRTAPAESALLRALAVARTHDIPWQQSLTVANLVQLRVGQRHFREAVRLGEAALAQLQPPAPRDTQAERVLLHELAAARLHLGQTDVARDYARRALVLAEGSSDAAVAAIARVVLAQADVALEAPGAIERYRAAIAGCEATGQLPRAAYHAARLAWLQRRAKDLDGLREAVAFTRRLAEGASTADLRGYAAAAQAQLDAAEGRGEQALQRLLEVRRDALRAENRIGAQRSGLDYVALAIDLGRIEAAGALLAELEANTDTEGDGLAMAEIWHRARGDEAGAEALRARREQLDAALPPPLASGAGEGA